ncbi:MAG: S41 family peptidase [Prevotella sp.]|nr:S41 family peptidase [Prevotella sp.]
MKKYIALAALLFTATMTRAQLVVEAPNPLTKFRMAQMAVSNLYVDKVDDNKLVEDAIRGMLKELDPHSVYSTPDEVKALTEPLQGNFEGIGVQFNVVEDTLMVIQPVVNGPSEKVGIVAGDRIVSVNDTAIAGVKMKKEDMMKRLRGPKGTTVKLGVVRPGQGNPLTFMVTRDKIPVYSIHASHMIRPGVGYVRIEQFAQNTYNEFMSAVAKLREQGMNTLILDLQDNGGGYLQTAVQIANEFLQRGDLVVYTEGRSNPRQTYNANGRGQLGDLHLYVLMNELSASASEILAGAIQDQDRGIVVGRRSFGKGLVQRPIDFSDGSMIRLTIAHYYTPSGRCIQKPYKKGDLKDYEMDFENRLKHGELTNPDSIHFADSLKFYTLKKHRTVYGGGGIMPDYFVPLDTTKYTRYHRKISAKNLIINANLRYVDQHRKELKKRYSTFEAFNSQFEVPQSLVDDILAEAKKQGIEPKDDDELRRTVPYLRTQLKALIARDIWDMNEYFQIINKYNDIVQKALELIQEG